MSQIWENRDDCCKPVQPNTNVLKKFLIVWMFGGTQKYFWGTQVEKY
jgi:hypothetical protein